MGEQKRDEQARQPNGCGKEGRSERVVLQSQNNEHVAPRRQRKEAHALLVGTRVGFANGRPKSQDVDQSQRDDGPERIRGEEPTRQSAQRRRKKRPIGRGDGGVAALEVGEPRDVAGDKARNADHPRASAAPSRVLSKKDRQGSKTPNDPGEHVRPHFPALNRADVGKEQGECQGDGERTDQLFNHGCSLGQSLGERLPYSKNLKSRKLRDRLRVNRSGFAVSTLGKRQNCLF